MDRNEIISSLKNFKDNYRDKYSIIKIGLFGSAAKENLKEDSDIDIVVDVTNPNLFNLIGIKLELEERFHRSVDIIRYHNKMNEFLKKRIDKEALYV
jgi:uncharacterized protein